MAGIYVHIPFCVRKCRYCDFYSVGKSESLISHYIRALSQDMKHYRNCFYDSDPQIDTVYFGGGTPSILDPNQIGLILDELRKVFPITADAEISMEVNPGTISKSALRRFWEAGVNRLSIGVQSFHDDELQFLGRIHRADQASSLVRDTAESGFGNIGLDLIYGIPYQTMQSWEHTLNETIALQPTHISAYALSWSKKTPLGREIESGAYPRSDEMAIAEMNLTAHDLLSDAGYEHYEVSNFAMPGFRCRHNESYWTGGAYLGLGPSAHSCIGEERFWNISDVNLYIDLLSKNRSPVADRERLSQEQQRLESLALGLRRRDGVPLDMVPEKSRTTSLIASGLAVIRDNALSLTTKGLLVADEIAVDLA